MEVRSRLIALFEDHQDIYRDELFGKNRLVIDGSDLIQQLYFGSGLEQNHGGEYAAFEKLIENFITTLRTCSISPFVVLQVAKDVNGKNFEQTLKLIRQANRAAVAGSQENILPPLASLLFKQTLVRLKVPMVVCYEEANQEIAALANEWDCPILSSNVDFYIFDVPAGILPYSHFQWGAPEQKDSQCFIACKNYSASNFCALFEIQKPLLPMFDALAKQKWSINWSQFSNNSSVTWFCLMGLLCWLKRFQLYEEAVEATLDLMPWLLKEERQKARDAIYEGMQKYWLPHSHLKNFFTDGTLPSFSQAEDVIPDWIQRLLVLGKMTTDIWEVLLFKRRVLRFCVGSHHLPSAYLISRPLRLVMYGLLLPEWDSSIPVEVVEADRSPIRTHLKMEDIFLAPVFKITGEKLQLDSLHKLEHSHRLRVLLKALEVHEAALSRFLPELHLSVAVTCYWWRKARPSLGYRLLKALLLGLCVGASQNQDEVADIKSHDCDADESNKFNVDVIHSVTQWQICLKDSIELNQLLGLPLPEPQISRLYEGAFINRLVQLMRTGEAKKLLKQSVSVVEEYRNMLAIVCQSACQQPQRGREARGKHVQDATDWEQQFDSEEEAAANRSLSSLDLEQNVPLKMRLMRNRRKNT